MQDTPQNIEKEFYQSFAWAKLSFMIKYQVPLDCFYKRIKNIEISVVTSRCNVSELYVTLSLDATNGFLFL